jgi:hypothetical protein
MARRGSNPVVVAVPDPSAELDRLAGRLDPLRTRHEVIEGFERLFRSGIAPDPWPHGPLEGRLLMTTTWRPWDGFVRRAAGWWMPWLGKEFDPAGQTGLNRFWPSPATRLWLKAMFPTHPARRVGDRVEAFPFGTAWGWAAWIRTYGC